MRRENLFSLLMSIGKRFSHSLFPPAQTGRATRGFHGKIRVCSGKMGTGFPEKTNGKQRNPESVWLGMNLTDSGRREKASERRNGLGADGFEHFLEARVVADRIQIGIVCEPLNLIGGTVRQQFFEKVERRVRVAQRRIG